MHYPETGDPLLRKHIALNGGGRMHASREAQSSVVEVDLIKLSATGVAGGREGLPPILHSGMNASHIRRP